MNYTITKTTFTELKPMVEEYLKTLNGVTEDYWEEHIMKAQFYKITLEQKEIGYIAIHNNEKITQFYLKDQYVYLAQQIFQQLIEEGKIKTAYVATCDQLFLSLCLDFQKQIELQAYFFDGTEQNEVRPAEYPRECLIKIDPEELEKVLIKSDGLFEPTTREQLETEEVMIYKLVVDQEELGYGNIVPNKLQTKYWACGMFTAENMRKHGIGRSIQLHLADICRENGYIPISGCWYYNHLSKKTIESAGRYSRTRLLNVIF